MGGELNCSQFNVIVFSSKFPVSFKFVDIILVFKMVQGIKRVTLDIKVSYLLLPKFVKFFYLNKFLGILKINFHNFPT